MHTHIDDFDMAMPIVVAQDAFQLIGKRLFVIQSRNRVSRRSTKQGNLVSTLGLLGAEFTTPISERVVIGQPIPVVRCGVVVQIVVGRKIIVLRLNIGVVRINTVLFGRTEMRQSNSQRDFDERNGEERRPDK